MIGLDLGEVESEAFWTEFLRGLRARGLRALRLVISEHHEGVRNAIARVLDAPWQRSQYYGSDAVITDGVDGAEVRAAQRSAFLDHLQVEVRQHRTR